MDTRTAAVVTTFALLLGCGQAADVASDPPPVTRAAPAAPAATGCEKIADEFIAAVNAYLAEAGPSIEKAPRMGKGDWPMDERRLRAAGCAEGQADDEFLDLVGERAPRVQGDDELAQYVRALLVALAEHDEVEEGEEVLAWLLLMGPPSWMHEPEGAELSSPNSVPRESPRMRRQWEKIERVMSRPPKFRMPGPAYPPPLDLQEPEG